MARPTVDLIRRKELVQAAMTAIHRDGEPTLSAICKIAGLSSASIVNHYFEGKQDLLECAMRELSEGFLDEIALRTGSRMKPIDRVFAVIDASFAPSQCMPEAVSCWLWFWSRTPSNPVFAEIERATRHRTLMELTRGLVELMPPNQVGDAAEGLMATMYGMWLRFAVDPQMLDADAARRITRDSFLLRLQVSTSPSRRLG